MAIHPLQPGDPAPDFALPAVNREGQVSLADYRGKGPFLVALFRGLHCPFCRRQIARLSATQKSLASEGVDTVAIVNTPLERARLYFQYRPTRIVLAADPDVRTHHAFGLFETKVLPDDADPNEQKKHHANRDAKIHLGRAFVNVNERLVGGLRFESHKGVGLQ